MNNGRDAPPQKAVLISKLAFIKKKKQDHIIGLSPNLLNVVPLKRKDDFSTKRLIGGEVFITYILQELENFDMIALHLSHLALHLIVCFLASILRIMFKVVSLQVSCVCVVDFSVSWEYAFAKSSWRFQRREKWYAGYKALVKDAKPTFDTTQT